MKKHAREKEGYGAYNQKYLVYEITEVMHHLCYLYVMVICIRYTNQF